MRNRGLKGETRKTLVRAGASIYDDIEDKPPVQRRKFSKKHTSDQFSFEDGSPLQDYPASVDIEVSDNEENTHKAHIIGYSDIYNSQILHTVETKATPEDDEDKHHLKPGTHYGLRKCVQQNSAENSRKCVPQTSAEILPPSVVSETQCQISSGLVVPTLAVEEAGSDSCTDHKPPSMPRLSTDDFTETQELLNKSLTDLLEMTAAMSDDLELNTEQQAAM